ncbi:E3 ubiquitin-protein ligase RNF10 isoform X2 [Oratosquilla oratoria]|uniref:E3 ubiquitin-protein ligase RNF10 isoform X2 n=1 Tax=Oratosquilla oratoria TaxID=337810 RepID=UPI003F777CA6
METPAMEKKAIVRAPPAPSKNGQDNSCKEFANKKNGNYARKREFDKPEYGRKPVGGRGGRPWRRNGRTREKTNSQIPCEQVATDDVVSEAGSVYRSGSKKQNITHLLDWWGPSPSERGHLRSQGGGSSYGRGARMRKYSSHLKYNKEHFLQANCQFVVLDGEDYSMYRSDPDLLVDWNLVQEVHLHVGDAPACPICLYPPTAPKVTRCGHIYCYPCILHYLALSDDKWRKCPICYEAVIKEDLKSVTAVCHKEFSIGEEIELQLMRRERDLLVPIPAVAYSAETVCQPTRLYSKLPQQPYAKLLLASSDEVRNMIIGRERISLETQLADEGEAPEACFIQEALSLLDARERELAKNGCQSPLLPQNNERAIISSQASFESNVSSTSETDSLRSPMSPDADKVAFPNEIPVGNVESKITPTADCGDKEVTEGNADEVEESVKEEPTVTVEDLDISQLQPVNPAAGGQAQRQGPKSTYYFYQASNGAHMYMHALNVQMLVREYGSLEKCPPLITAKIIDKESSTMTEDLRGRLRYLRHLPLSCVFEVVELNIKQPLVSKLVMAEFQDKIEARRRTRTKKAREERRIEKRIQAQEDKLLGRSRSVYTKADSLMHFPSFSNDDPPLSSSYGKENGGSLSIPDSHSERSNSPTIDSHLGSSVDSTGQGPSFAQMIRDGETKLPHSQSEPVSMTKTVWPSLGAQKNSAACSAWGPGCSGIDVVKSRPVGLKLSHSVGNKLSEAHKGDKEESDNEDFTPVPEFKHAFSSAFAKALDNATKVSQEGTEDVKSSGNNKKGKKKKQKAILLFSSGAHGWGGDK